MYFEQNSEAMLTKKINMGDVFSANITLTKVAYVYVFRYKLGRGHSPKENLDF